MHATEQPRTIAALRALLEQQQADYDARFARQEQEIAALRRQLEQPRGKAGKRAGTKGISRASLLKGAAAGVAGLAAAELSGTLGATPSFATTTDTNLVASGGSGTGVQVGGQSTTDYGYGAGGVFYGSGTGVAGYAVDSTGAANGGIGVHGQSGSGTGVEGGSGSGWGVYGYSNSSDGVYGHSNMGIGVQGLSATYLGGWFFGGRAPIFLEPAAAAGPPATGVHFQGEIMIDNTGVPYVCSGGDGTTLGTWQAIGNLRSFPTPRRLFGAFVGNGSSYGPVDATKKLNGTASGVPAGASAVYAAVQSDQPGRLTLYPDGTTDPGIANWTNNGTGGILFLTYMLVPLSAAGAFRFHSYISGNVYVDAWGYLL